MPKNKQLEQRNRGELPFIPKKREVEKRAKARQAAASSSSPVNTPFTPQDKARIRRENSNNGEIKNSNSFNSAEKYADYLGRTLKQNENGNAVSEELSKEKKRLRKEAGLGNLAAETAGDVLSWLAGAGKAALNASSFNTIKTLSESFPDVGIKDIPKGIEAIKDGKVDLGEVAAKSLEFYKNNITQGFAEGKEWAEGLRTSERHAKTDAYQTRMKDIESEYQKVLLDEHIARQEAAAGEYEAAAGNDDFVKFMSQGLLMKDGEYAKPQEKSAEDATFMDLLMKNMNARDGGSAFAAAAGKGLENVKHAADFEGELANPAVYAAKHAEELIKMDTFGKAYQGGIVSPEYLYMNDGEIQIYSYYLAKEGREKADEYFESISHRLKERRGEKQYTNQKEWAKDHPWAASGLSVATNLGQVGSLVNTAGTAVKNVFTDINAPVDQYSPLTAPSRVTSSLREGTMENMDKEWQKFLYSTGMSMADCATQAAIFGPEAAGYVMASNAAGATAYEAAKDGVPADQALMKGTLAGLTEFATEKLPLDNLFKLAEGGTKFISPQTVSNILKQSGIEATEELCSSYANLLTDIMISGNDSEYNQYIDYLMESGMSRSEAESEAVLHYFVEQPMQDAAAGALSGFAFGAGGSAYGDVGTRVTGRGLNASDVTSAAGNTGDAELARMADIVDQQIIDGKVDNFDLGSLQIALDHHNSLPENVRRGRSLADLVKSGTATAAETIEYKIRSGEELTTAELRELYADKRAMSALGKALGMDIVGKDYSRMSAELKAMQNKMTTLNAQQSEDVSALDEQYEERIAEIEEARAESQAADMMQRAEGSLNSPEAVDNYFSNAVNAPASRQTKQNDAADYIMGGSAAPSVSNLAQGFRDSRGAKSSAFIDSGTAASYNKENIYGGDIYAAGETQKNDSRRTQSSYKTFGQGVRNNTGYDSEYENTIGDIRSNAGERYNQSLEQFLADAEKDGYQVVSRGDKHLAYKIAEQQNIPNKISEIANKISAYGIEVIVTEGNARVHYESEGVTVVRGDAFTENAWGKQRIFLKNDAETDVIEEIAEHELCHVAQLRGLANEYTDAVLELVDLSSENAKEILAELYNTYADREVIYKEIPAYVAGWLSVSREYAAEILGDAVSEEKLEILDSLRNGMMTALKQSSKKSASTVTVGEGADFSSLDISNKRKSQLSAASAVFGRLGVQADIDVKGDILSQAGAQVYERIKNSPAVSRALSEYFGGQWSEFSSQEKADHAARFIGEAVRKEAAGERLNSSEKAITDAITKGSVGVQNVKGEHDDINSPKNRLAGAKVDLEYAQMKADEYGTVPYGGTLETRKRFEMWNNEVKRLQKEIARLEEQVGDTVSEDEDNDTPKFMARKSEVDGSSDGEYNKNNTSEGVNERGRAKEGADSELLAGGAISTAGRSGNGVRQQGTNSAKLVEYLGNVGRGKTANPAEYRAGESGWLVRAVKKKSRLSRLETSFLRTLSRVTPSGKDTIGRVISTELQEELRNTVFKNEDGDMLSLYHWTDAAFEVFSRGEVGFHFGTLDSAHDRYAQMHKERNVKSKGTYKEVYLNIKSPLELSDEDGSWDAGWIAFQLKIRDEISQEQYNQLAEISGFYSTKYDDPAGESIREILKEKGYDGIIYRNQSEDIGSYSVMALYPDQIITVAENGVLVPGCGVTMDDDGGEIKFSAHRSNAAQRDADAESDYADYDKPITSEDVEVLRSIGRKSINAFSAEDTKKSQKWAYKFWQQLGTKSPFFRAWFGDWRVYDTKEYTAIEIDTTAEPNSGRTTNEDTERMVSWSKDVVKESVLNAAKGAKDDVGIIAANMSEVVKNAVLLDTTVSMHSSKRKMPGTAFMHSMYAIAKIDNKQILVKLFTEEALPNKGGEPFMRAYTLKYIEKVAEFDNGVLSQNGGLTESHSTTINSISDLFALVKKHDPDFKPHEINPALLNEDGTPKVLYHGSTNHFNVFNFDRLGTNGTSEGYGFYFTDKRDIAEGYSHGTEAQRHQGADGKLFEVYLNIKKPLSDTEVTMTRSEFKKFLLEMNEQVDEDGEPLDFLANYGDVEWEGLDNVIDNVMSVEYDGSNSDVNMIHSIINGCGNMEIVFDVLRKTTGYDGIIVEDASWGGEQTIYVAFHPDQIKSATDNIGTFDRKSNDIRFAASSPSSQNSLSAADALPNIEGGKYTVAQMKDIAEQIGYKFVGKGKKAMCEELSDALSVAAEFDPGLRIEIAGKTQKSSGAAAKTETAKNKSAAVGLSERAAKAYTDKTVLRTNRGRMVVPVIDPMTYTFRDAELTASYRRVERIARAFGKRVVWVAGNSITIDGKSFPVDGGFYYNGQIYLNIENMTEAYTWLFGHEYCHYVLAKDKKKSGGTLLKDYYNLRRAWAEKKGTLDAFEARINDIIENRVFDESDPDAVFEEFMCDDLGTFMMNEDFARFAIAEKRTLWQKITYAIGNFINKLKNLGAKRSELRELEQLHAFMLSALNDYRAENTTQTAQEKLPANIRHDAAKAKQLIKDSYGRYKPREFRTASPTSWTQSTAASDNALKDVTTRRAAEVDKYGYRKVSDGQSEYRIYVVNPNSQKLNKAHKDNIQAVRSFAAATGTRIGFATGNAIMTAREGNEYTYKFDAINDNGTVYVNLDAADPYTAIVGAHWYNQCAAANPARARTLARTIKRINKLTGGKATAQDMAVKQITSSERSSYALLPRAQMTAEALKMTSADLLATLSRDKSLAKSVAKEQPSLIHRALDVTGDMLSRLTGTTEERAKKLMQQAEANLLYALNSSAENNTTPEGSKISTAKKKPLPNGMRAMSIKMLENGARYVEVDTDQARFDGLTAAEAKKEARKVILERFRGKVIGEGENKAYVNNRTAEEFSHPANWRIPDEAVMTKMRTSAELDNLMSVSELIGQYSDDGRHPDAVNGWQRYSVTFKVNDAMYTGEISVKCTQRGKVFYDLTKIKDITGHQLVNAEELGTPSSSGNVSDINIPHPSDDVKFSALRKPTREENRAWLDEYSEQYGAIPEGENVNSRGNQNVPKQVDDDTRTRQTARTYLEALSTPDAVVGEVEKDIINGRFSYTPVSNVAANQNADRILARGYDEAMAQWQGVVHGDRIADKKSIALGERLIIEAANRGDTAAATRMIAEVAAEATRAGQIVQAISMVKRLSPTGQLLSIQRQVNKLNDELARRGKEVSISEDKLKEFTDIAKQLEKAQQRIGELEEMLENGEEHTENGYTEDELADAKEQEQRLKEKLGEVKNDIVKDVAEQVPPSWVDKLNAWRYLAMLGNPRTHIRNLIGNAVFIPTVKLKQAMASGLERMFVSKGSRTQSVVAPKSIREFAAQDAAEQLEWLKSGGKYNATDEISEQTKAFSDKNMVGKALNKVSDFNSRALDAEDGIFLKYHYQTALAGYAAANGISAYQLENDEKLLQKARDFAAREAQRATYRDMNAFSDFMTKASKKLRAKQGMGGALAYAAFEGIVPFKKTPCNIVKRSIEYSPIGVMTALSKGAHKLIDNRKGVANDYTASEFINDLSAGMTGTMIVALGALLSSLGMLRGRNKDKEDEFKKLQGAQEYSLVIGDWSYTIDWMSPVALPLFVGAELHDQITNTNEELTLKSMLDSLVMIAEPIFNLSMMDGVQSVLQSYSSEGAIVDMFTGAVESFAGQMFPTVGGQIARTIDPKSRNAYYNDKNSGVPSFISQTTRSAMSKTPFLQSKLPERIDAWGRNPGEGQGLFERAAENFFSPGYYSKSKTTEVDKVIQQIYEETGDSSILPANAGKYFSYNSENYYMSADEYVTYAKTRGQTAYNIIDDLRQSSAFNKLSADDKAACISDAYKLATSIAKSGTDSGYSMDDAAKWQREAYNSGSYAEAILGRR